MSPADEDAVAAIDGRPVAQVVPGKSRAPLRPSITVRRRQVSRSRQSGSARSISFSSRRHAWSGLSSGRIGICAWTSSSPWGARLESAAL